MPKYYKQVLVNGVWLLFREGEAVDEVYRFKAGWAPSKQLFERMSNGEIDDGNLISEEDAFGLIRSLGEDPAATAPGI